MQKVKVGSFAPHGLNGEGYGQSMRVGQLDSWGKRVEQQLVGGGSGFGPCMRYMLTLDRPNSEDIHSNELNPLRRV